MSADRTDPMAAHRAAQQLRDLGVYDSGTVADQFVVAFERRVNEHGVAVRRVVLYGPEEVDPNPPAELLAQVRERLTELATAEVIAEMRHDCPDGVAPIPA